MGTLFETVTDLEAGAATIARRPYGMIEVVDRQLRQISFRPWPKMISLPEVWWDQRMHARRPVADRCRLYYNQPASCPSFLNLAYIVSSARASFGSFRASLRILDEVARIKRSDAIVTDVTNHRISDRLLARWGWESHVPNSRRRNFIKRFYGEYPRALQAPVALADSSAPSPH